MAHPASGGDEVAEAKERLRVAVLGMVRGIDDRQRRAASARACEHLARLRSVHLAGVVVLHAPPDVGLDPSPVRRVLEERGVRTLVPRWTNDELHLVDAADPGLLVAGDDGAVAPPAVDDLDLVDLVVAPGVAFDLDGGRLGTSDGRWDRLLALLPGDAVRIGLSHTAQLVTRVPREPGDQVLDIVITDRGVHHSGARTARRDA